MHLAREYESNPANVPSDSVTRYKALFIFLQVAGGQIGMPLFVGTMLVAPSVKRHLTLVNFCASWIIYSIVYCLTIYHEMDRSTGLGYRVCVAQAAMVHGAVPLSVVTYCALHIQVWMGVQRALSQTSWVQRQKKRILTCLFFAPYIVFTIFSVVSLLICLKHPDLVDSTGAYYCTINYDPLVFAVPGFAAGVIAIMIILEIIIGISLLRRWKAVRSSQRLNAASISMIVRIAIFSVYGFATLAACAAFLARSLSIWPYLVQASLPTAVFLMFGTRADVWGAWEWAWAWTGMRCSKRKVSRQAGSSLASSLAASKVTRPRLGMGSAAVDSPLPIHIDIEKSVTVTRTSDFDYSRDDLAKAAYDSDGDGQNSLESKLSNLNIEDKTTGSIVVVGPGGDNAVKDKERQNREEIIIIARPEWTKNSEDVESHVR